MVAADPMTGRVALELPTASAAGGLAVELSTMPFIGLVWLGAILVLVSALLVTFRRAGGTGPERGVSRR